MSGYLNNPPRTILIDGDNRPGSYPSHISPSDINASNDIKPFRDTVSLDAPQAYGKSLVTFNRVPSNGHEIDIVNSNGVSFKFVFLSSTSFVLGTNQYAVDTTSLRVSEGSFDLGLDAEKLTIRNYAQKFISAVNAISDFYVTASPGSSFQEVILTQNIPGTAGNTSNTSSSTHIKIDNFSGASDLEVRYPFKVYVDGNQKPAAEILRRVISKNYPGTLQPNSGTLQVNTSGDVSQVEAYSEQHGFADFSPFDESNSHQAFGVSTGGSDSYGTRARIYDRFFREGSVSGSLNEPLNAKDKIVIDISPVEETKLQFDPNDNLNFPMSYFNFETKKWERIGIGATPLVGSSKLDDELDTYYIGFSQNLGNNITSSADIKGVFDSENLSNTTFNKKIMSETGWASCIDTFGFPLHPKFHATGSQTLDTSNFIDRPFLVEKLVYEFSCSSRDNAFGADLVSSTDLLNLGATFFILNQRIANPDPGQESSYTSVYIKNDGTEYSVPYANLASKIHHYSYGSIPQNRSLTKLGFGESVYVNTVRDVVTFSRIGAIWDTYDNDVVSTLESWAPHPANFMDLAIEVPKGGYYEGSFTIADSIKTPTSNPGLARSVLYAGTGTEIFLAKDSSTRNSIDVPTGRARNAEFAGPELSYSVICNKSDNSTQIVYAPKKDAINSPYLIMPGDKLVFGWQSSFPGDYTATGEVFYICPGKGKIILYGSYLSDDKPVHNIFKDQLISDSAHEAIPAGPWALDVFDTEPAMMYTGSMREEYVRGTMLTRTTLTKSGWIPTDQNNSNLVRRVRGRVSDGDVQQRWSLNRNVRLIDSNEQYYDSMQLSPLKMLFNYKNSTSAVISSGGSGYVIIMLPDETNAYQQYWDTYANKKFIGSFAYEDPLYTSIERVKRINDKVINGISVSTINGSTGSPDRARPIQLIIVQGGRLLAGTVNTKTYNKKALLENGATPRPDGITYLFTSNQYDTNPNDEVASDIEILGADQIDPYSLTQEKINYHLSRFFGCFGDGYLGMMQYGIQGSFGIFKNQIYRGTRYGLVNPTPFYSNAVYIANHYGQFRDMLEQRQYTRFSTEDNTITDSAVEVVFINRNAQLDPFGNPYNSVVNGIQTNSTNVSTFCTSSIPYDDSLWTKGWIRDRLDPLPETLVT